MFLNATLQILVVAFAGLMVWAAVCDGRTLKIPNRIPAAVAVLWIGYAALRLLGGAPAGSVLTAAGLGLLAFAIGTGLFALRLAGGGDVKLFAAGVPWAGPALSLEFLLITLLAGGLISLAIVAGRVARQLVQHTIEGQIIVLPAVFTSAFKTTLPFGIAIAAGGLFVAYRLLFGAPAF